MWLSNLFTKTKNNECEDSINEDIVNEESINVSSNHEEEPVINDLKKRVEHVKMIYAKLQILQNKQDLDVNNNCTNTVNEKHDQCTSTNENEKNLEINNCKIDDVLKIIPVIETNLQILTEKVSCLSGLFDEKQLNSTIITEQNITSNSSVDVNQCDSNSINKLNGIVNKTTLPSKDTLVGIDPEENMKTHKNKQSIIMKKKESHKKVKDKINSTDIINKNNQNIVEENVPEYNVKLVDQLINLDGQLESFYKNIQSALNQYKIDQIKEKSEIIDNLSRLEKKINIHYTKMDKLMSNVEYLSKLHDPVKQDLMKNQSNVEIKSEHELQKSKDDIKVCIDYLIKPNPIIVQETQSCITTDDPITNTHFNDACKINRCVCQLIDNTNVTKIISHDGNNQVKYGDIILSEFLKTKLINMEKIEQDEYQPKVVQLNQLTNQINDKKNSYSSVCSKKSCNFFNICIENQINDIKTSHLSVCSNEPNHFPNSCVGNQIDHKKTSHLSVCSNEPNHFSSSCVGNQIDHKKTSHLSVCSNEPNHFPSSCVGNQIDHKKTSHLSVCSNEPNHFPNNCVVNQINDQKTSHLSKCSKNLNHLKNNGVTKQDEEQKTNRLTVGPKKSFRHLSKIGVEFDTKKSNQLIKKKSVCTNNICDFLSSQPIPEWIRRDETLVASDNLCCKDKAKSSTKNSNLNVMKFYNIEKIIKDSYNKKDIDDIVYEITRKH